MMHSLCFNGFADGSSGVVPSSYAGPFDMHIVMKNGLPYFHGENVQKIYGGDVPLSPGNLFHVGNSTDGAALVSDVMEGFTYYPFGRRYISNLDLAIFLFDSSSFLAAASS